MTRWIGAAALAATFMLSVSATNSPVVAADAQQAATSGATDVSARRYDRHHHHYLYHPYYPYYYGHPYYYSPGPFLLPWPSDNSRESW